MIVARTNLELQAARSNLPGTVGLVMTMGALHAGHLSLVEAAREHATHVVVSIFVNPTQFAQGEDYDRYPRTLEADLAALETVGVDMVYAPTVTDMYPHPPQATIEPGAIAHILEGEVRPTHFAGVSQVVLKMIHRVRPQVAVFGQKDAQQYEVLRQVMGDLDVPVELVCAPIIRETDGLAMSSRNRYLSVEERQLSQALSQALQAGVASAAQGGTPDQIVSAVRAVLENPVVAPSYTSSTPTSRTSDAATLVEPKAAESEAVDATGVVNISANAAARVTPSPTQISVDYVALASIGSFQVICGYGKVPREFAPLPAGGAECYLLVAARVGKTRLIDNVIVEVSAHA